LESEQWLKFNDGFDGYGLAVIDNDVYSDGCECYNGLSEYEDGYGNGEYASSDQRYCTHYLLR
jgi:hypothetical protein